MCVFRVFVNIKASALGYNQILPTITVEINKLTFPRSPPLIAYFSKIFSIV